MALDKRTVACSHCGKTYRVPPSAERLKAKCKGCGEAFIIEPGPAEAAEPAADIVWADDEPAGEAEQRGPAVWWLVGGGGTLALIGVGVVLWVFLPGGNNGDTPEADDTPQAPLADAGPRARDKPATAEPDWRAPIGPVTPPGGGDEAQPPPNPGESVNRVQRQILANELRTHPDDAPLRRFDRSGTGMLLMMLNDRIRPGFLSATEFPWTARMAVANYEAGDPVTGDRVIEALGRHLRGRALQRELANAAADLGHVALATRMADGLDDARHRRWVHARCVEHYPGPNDDPAYRDLVARTWAMFTENDGVEAMRLAAKQIARGDIDDAFRRVSGPPSARYANSPELLRALAQDAGQPRLAESRIQYGRYEGARDEGRRAVAQAYMTAGDWARARALMRQAELAPYRQLIRLDLFAAQEAAGEPTGTDWTTLADLAWTAYHGAEVGDVTEYEAWRTVVLQLVEGFLERDDPFTARAILTDYTGTIQARYAEQVRGRAAPLFAKHFELEIARELWVEVYDNDREVIARAMLRALFDAPGFGEENLAKCIELIDEVSIDRGDWVRRLGRAVVRHGLDDTPRWTRYADDPTYASDDVFLHLGILEQMQLDERDRVAEAQAAGDACGDEELALQAAIRYLNSREDKDNGEPWAFDRLGPLSRDDAERLGAELWALYRSWYRYRDHRGLHSSWMRMQVGGREARFPYRLVTLVPPGELGLTPVKQVDLPMTDGRPVRLYVVEPLRYDPAALPEGGLPLVLGLGTPSTEGWLEQLALAREYAPEGVYLVPEAMNHNRGWADDGLVVLWPMLVKRMVAAGVVDPDRVALVGRSPGVLQIAEHAPDLWSAVAIADTQPMGADDQGFVNLHGVPFLFQPVQPELTEAEREDEAARLDYETKLEAARSNTARVLAELEQLAQSHPGQYRHRFLPTQDEDTPYDAQAAGQWVHQHIRDPYPERIDWRPTDPARSHRYWLKLEGGFFEHGLRGLGAQPEADQQEHIVATRDGNRFNIQVEGDFHTVRIQLNDAMIDFERPVVVHVNGNEYTYVRVERSLGTMLRTLGESGDPAYMFPAELVIDLWDDAGSTP